MSTLAFRMAATVLGLTLAIGPARAATQVAGVPSLRVTDLGPLPAATPIRLAVVLQYRDEDVLRTMTSGRGPTTVLTGAQFDAAFAPTKAAYARTIAALARRGLHVVQTYPNRTVVDVSGTAADVERAFATDLHAVRQSDGTRTYANVRAAYLPPELAGDVFGVAGCDETRTLHTANVRATSPISVVAAATKFPIQAPDTGFGPQAFTTAYDFPVMHTIAGRPKAPTYDGMGQAAAVVIDADYLDSDLTAFMKYFGVDRTGPPTKRIKVGFGPPKGLVPDSDETTLDVETIVGTTPGVALSVYLMHSLTSRDIIDAYAQVDSDDDVGAVNSSFGGCETQTTPSNFPKMTDHLAMQGTALGIVFSASTGDSGVFDCNTGATPDGVSTPASGPHFVAVGGTTLVFDRKTAAYQFEYGWAGSGGGTSAIFPTPTYQSGLANIVGTTRNIPDIAFDADPRSGAGFYYAGSWQGPIGGTSLASPLFVGLVTQLAQYGGANLGDTHAPIYRAFGTYGYTSPAGVPLFHDITIGNNGYYSALAGYDQVTGIGSIDGWNFATATHL
jgi:subtilase family serine protease